MSKVYSNGFNYLKEYGMGETTTIPSFGGFMEPCNIYSQGFTVAIYGGTNVTPIHHKPQGDDFQGFFPAGLL